MATISNTPRPGYVWDSTDNVWYPIGTGPHTHADYITSGSAINPNIVDAKGDIIAATAADTVSRLAVGSNDQVLTADSTTATGLKWATPSAGGMTLISETTASALSSLSLSSIPGTYKQLLLIWSGIKHSGAGSTFSIRLNNNSGSIYSYGTIGLDSTTAVGTYGADSSFNSAFGYRDNYTQLHYQARGWLQIDNYASTTKVKNCMIRFSYADNGAGVARGYSQLVNFNDTTAVTSIDIVRESGTDTFSNDGNTSIRLYGIS